MCPINCKVTTKITKQRVLAAAAAAAAKSLQSCPTLCDPIDGSPPSSPVPGKLKFKKEEKSKIIQKD